MIFRATAISGVWELEIEPHRDDRGFFARTFCREEFLDHGLCGEFVQSSVSFNHAKGTLRGLHYQAAPAEESKLVRCTRGSIFDVALDLRPASPTYRQWIGAELTEDNRMMLYIPPGVAHGFQTLAAGTEVLYQISPAYRPDLARGVRWNDPVFAISWPEDERTISERDASYPDFQL